MRESGGLGRFRIMSAELNDEHAGGGRTSIARTRTRCREILMLAFLSLDNSQKSDSLHIPITSTFHWSPVCRGTPTSMSIPPPASLRLRFLMRRTVCQQRLNVQTFNPDQVNACLCLYRLMSSHAQTRLPCLGVVTSGVACVFWPWGPRYCFRECEKQTRRNYVE